MGNESMYKSRTVANLANKAPNKSNKQKKLATTPFASLIVHNGRQFPLANIVQRKGNHLDNLSEEIKLWLEANLMLNIFVRNYVGIEPGDTDYITQFKILRNLIKYADGYKDSLALFNTNVKNVTKWHREGNFLELTEDDMMKVRKSFVSLLYKEMDFVRKQAAAKQPGPKNKESKGTISYMGEYQCGCNML
jgi:hypothetical protein